jgi:hypothetical protein
LRKHGWWEWCSPALIEGSRFWNPSQSILEISSAQEGGTKIRHEKEKGDICTQQEPTKTKRKKKRRPKAGICWCTIEEVFSAAQGTKNGIEESKGDDEKKESSRTSGCDKNYDEGTQPQRSLSLLRSAEDMRAVRSRVNIIN